MMGKHADVEIRSKDTKAPEQSKKTMSLYFFFQSVVLAVLFPIVLLCSGGGMWQLSLLLCCYFHSAVYVLSAATRKGKARLLVRLTYAAFLALIVDAVLSRAAGTIVMFLDSVWNAGLFGHALADHRAHEKAAGNPGLSCEEVREKLVGELRSIVLLALVYSTAGCPPCMLAAGCSLEFFVVMIMVIILLSPVAMHVVLGKHKPSEKAAATDDDAQGMLAGELGSIIFLSLVLSAYGMCPMCIVMSADGLSPLEFVLVIMPMVLCCHLPVVIIYTLRGRGHIVTFLGVEYATAEALVRCYTSSFILFIVSFLLARKGEAVVAILWICVLGLAVLLGYCLRLLPFYRSKAEDGFAVQADEVKKK